MFPYVAKRRFHGQARHRLRSAFISRATQRDTGVRPATSAARPWERVSKSVLTACWPGCRRDGFSDQKNRAIAGLFADRHFAPFDPAGQTIVGYYEGFSIAATGRCSAVPAIRPSATRRSGARIRTAIAARCASLNPATRLGSAASSCLRRPRCTGRARSTARQHAEAPRRTSMVRSAERLPGVVRRKTDMANPFCARRPTSLRAEFCAGGGIERGGMRRHCWPAFHPGFSVTKRAQNTQESRRGNTCCVKGCALC